jgi:hypothetical protein
MNWRHHPLHCECEECASPDPTHAGKRGAACGLTEQLTRRGVSFNLAGDRLRFFPKESVEDEDLEELRRLKLEVLALLSEDEARRHRGEGNVHDELEVFNLACDVLGADDKQGAA